MNSMTRFRITALAAFVTLAGGSYLAAPAQAATVPPCSIALLVDAIESSCDNGGSAVNVVNSEGGCSYTIVCN